MGEEGINAILLIDLTCEFYQFVITNLLFTEFLPQSLEVEDTMAWVFYVGLLTTGIFSPGNEINSYYGQLFIIKINHIVDDLIEVISVVLVMF